MQVPTLHNQVSPRAAPNIEVRPLQSTAAQDIGQGVTNVGSTLLQVQKQEQLKADRAAFMDAERQTDTVANGIYAKAQNAQLKDAIGITPKALEEFDKTTSEVEQGLKNDRQKLTYRESVNQRRSQLQRSIESHENGQRETYYAKSRDDYKAQAYTNAVTYYNDPKRVESEIEGNRAAIDQTPGLDDTMKAAELNERRAGVYMGVMDRYLANDQIKQAEAYYKTVKSQLGDKVARVENALIDAKARVAAAAKTQAINTQVGRVLTRYQSDGPEGGSAMLAALAKQLPPDVMGEVYSKVNSFLSQTRTAKQEERADDLKNIYSAIATGQAGPDQIQLVDSLWKDNAFTPTERASLIGRIEDVQVRRAGDQATAAVIREALSTGLPLDPSNSDIAKGVSSAFSQDTVGVKAGSEPWQQVASAYAVRTRMLPQQATAWVRSAIRSPDPRVAGPAVQFFGSVAAESPDAVSGFDAQTKAFAGMAASMIEAGTPQDKAIEVARQTTLEQNAAVLKQREEAYRKVTDSDAALNNFIDRDFDTWTTSQPGAPASLKFDFSKQTGRYFQYTGDLQTARDLAWADLKRVYGVSEVNGVKQMMMLPPEHFGIKPEEVRKEVGPDTILVPDSVTMRQVNDIMDGKPVMPSYKLLTKTGELMVNERGIPLRYTLPSGDDLAQRLREAQAKAETEAREQVAAARVHREVRQRATEETLRRYP